MDSDNNAGYEFATYIFKAALLFINLGGCNTCSTSQDDIHIISSPSVTLFASFRFNSFRRGLRLTAKNLLSVSLNLVHSLMIVYYHVNKIMLIFNI